MLAACLGAAVVLATRGTTFLPAFNEGSAQVNLSLETASAFGRRLEGLLMEIDGIAHVARRTGRAEGGELVMPVSLTEAVVSFDPESTRSREEILDDIRDRVAERFPGVANETEQPLAHLLSHLLSGVTAPRGSDNCRHRVRRCSRFPAASCCSSPSPSGSAAPGAAPRSSSRSSSSSA